MLHVWSEQNSQEQTEDNTIKLFLDFSSIQEGDFYTVTIGGFSSPLHNQYDMNNT